MNISIKASIFFSLLLLATGLFAKGDKKEKGIFHVKVSVDIAAPAEEVWDILGRQFAEIDIWSSTVTESVAVPFEEVPAHVTASTNSKVAGRTTTSKALEATEILIAYSDSGREFTFQAVKTPGFIVYARNHSTVTELGTGRSRVTFDIDMKLKGVMSVLKGKFKKKLTKAMGQVQQDLKHYAETGKPAPSK